MSETKKNTNIYEIAGKIAEFCDKMDRLKKESRGASDAADK